MVRGDAAMMPSSNVSIMWNSAFAFESGLGSKRSVRVIGGSADEGRV